MKQGKPLQRKPWNYKPKPRTKRGPRVHAASGRPKAPREIPAKVREAVEARAQGLCDLCAAPLGEPSDKHHRKLRSRGVDHSPENIVVVHHECHMWLHEHPREATSQGFMVHSWENPAEIPVLIGDGQVSMPMDWWQPVDDLTLREFEDRA